MKHNNNTIDNFRPSNKLQLLLSKEQILQNKLEYDEVFDYSFYTIKTRDKMEKNLMVLREKIDERINLELNI